MINTSASPVSVFATAQGAVAVRIKSSEHLLTRSQAETLITLLGVALGRDVSKPQDLPAPSLFF